MSLLRSALRALVPVPVGSTFHGWRPLARAHRTPVVARLARHRVHSVTHAGVSDLAMGMHHPVNLGLGHTAFFDGDALDVRFARAAATGVLKHRCGRPDCDQVRLVAVLHLSALITDPALAEDLAVQAAGQVGPDAFLPAPGTTLMHCLLAGVDPVAVAGAAGVPFSVLAAADTNFDGAVFEHLGAPADVIAALAAHLKLPAATPVAELLAACQARLGDPAAWPLLTSELHAVSCAPAAVGPILASLDGIADVVADVAALRMAGAPGSLDELAEVAR